MLNKSNMDKKEMNIDLNTAKTLDEAVELLPKLSTSKFVGSVNIDIVLNLKEKQKKEIIRGSVNLPFSFGESKKVIVFCEEALVDKALKAGAVKAGLEDLVKEIEGGFSDFDVALATPNVMTKIVRLGRVLGPKGLMPNPNSGTITSDIETAIKSFMSGKMNFKSNPEQGTIRTKLGEINMSAEDLKSNIKAFVKAVAAEAKKLNANPFKKVTLSPTMGKGVKLDLNDLMQQVN